MSATGCLHDRRLLRELGDAGGERVAVEHAGQRVDDRLAAVLEVGAASAPIEISATAASIASGKRNYCGLVGDVRGGRRRT